MPLHRHEEVVARCLERLHEAVVGRRRDDDARTDAVDALVVVAVHAVVARADQLGQARPGRDLDGVLGEHASADAVAVGGRLSALASERLGHLGPERFGQVLVQRAAEGDVDQLQAAADAEHRHAAALRAGEQGELPRVAVGARRVGRRVALGAVELGLHVEAAREDQPVEPVEHDLRGALGLCLRGQQHGGGARRGHRLEVLLRQERGAHVPHPLARTLEVGGEAHHGQVRVVRSHARAPNR